MTRFSTSLPANHRSMHRSGPEALRAALPLVI